ncbi:MAG: hypothetical protein OEW06_08980, partial [Gemmatimonadota bacterium]|nr:hypothetical protein [Gemmatimonadota bacterium]
MTRTLLLLPLAILAACGAPRTNPVVDEPVACEVLDLANCRQSGDVVFGGQPTPATLQFLADHGYTTVVSTRGLTEVDWDERV